MRAPIPGTRADAEECLVVSAVQRSFLSPSWPPARPPAPPIAAGLHGLPVCALLPVGEQATQAAWRAALVARDRRVPLHLVGADPVALGRDRAIARAMALLAGVLHATGAGADDAQPRVQVGDAATEILRAAGAAGAELLVVGVPPRPGWRAWLPATSRRLLRDTAADVLLVPLQRVDDAPAGGVECAST